MSIRFLVLVSVLMAATAPASAFCGFYVARADGQLFNEASKVVFMRDRNQSSITMSSDYQGAPRDFAMIVPTPRVLKREQIRTVDAKTIDHLDNYTAPRLVEYHDYDPCEPMVEPMVEVVEEGGGGFSRKQKLERRRGAKALGVTIKAEYSVDNYDILILDAKQSDGLVTFLRNDGYKIPDGLADVLGGYIKGGMKFFVAKVNLKRHSAKKKQTLKPLQISFRSSKFMLPIQLGKVNARGPQDLLLMTLTRTGRVETANYRTQRIPTDNNVPSFVKKHFGAFYRDMFARQVGRSGVMLEYAWDMAWCDPCAADPLSAKQLSDLGVTWLSGDANAGQDVFVTRLHLRYDKNSFRQDLKLKHTKDRSNFQGRYVMNHPFRGNVSCEAGKEYVKNIRIRLREEAVELNRLTGWAPRDIEKRIRRSVPASYW
ncbi:MAG: DUF2330 domain-containing protein [Rhodobacteraceae bacterium]|nr:DUF2330 domain-containing protein [Paracoccaceae bacterium]